MHRASREVVGTEEISREGAVGCSWWETCWMKCIRYISADDTSWFHPGFGRDTEGPKGR